MNTETRPGSSVATRLADEAAARGATVTWGTSWASARAPGFWPWTQPLRACVRAVPDALGSLAPAERVELARVLPELAPASPPVWVVGDEPVVVVDWWEASSYART